MWLTSMLSTAFAIDKKSSLASGRDLQRIYELDKANKDISKIIPEYASMMKEMKEKAAYYSMTPHKSPNGKDILKPGERKEVGNAVIQLSKQLRELAEDVNEKGAKLDRDQYAKVRQAYIDLKATRKLN